MASENTNSGTAFQKNDGICPGCGCKVDSSVSSQECVRCLLELASDDSLQHGETVQSPVSYSQPAVLTRFGDYELKDEIARGGMGVVYRAQQISLRRTVAIKMILAGQLATPESVLRFKAEAEAAAKLDHPGIVPIYEIGEFETQHYFSMKLIDGANLEQLLDTFALGCSDQKAAHSRHRQQRIAKLISKVARALDYAHQHGVLHRDVKPTNILIDRDDNPHLTDFGLAKLIGNEPSGLTLSAVILGSPSYMAPEQTTGDSSNVTTLADVYGLGAVLYELLTRKPPFMGTTALATMRKLVDTAPKQPSQINKNVHPDLETIALKCLEKNPGHRYPGAAALGDELDRFVRGEPILARPVSRLEHCWRWCRRNRVLASLLLMLVIVTVTGFAGTAWKWRDAELARARVALERDAARWQAYRANIAAAASSLRLHPDGVKSALDAAPPEYRNWEWHYCQGQLFKPISVLKPTTDYETTESADLYFDSHGRVVVVLRSMHALRTIIWNHKTQQVRQLPIGMLSSDGAKSAMIQRDGHAVVTNEQTGAQIELRPDQDNPAELFTRDTSTGVNYFSPNGDQVSTVTLDRFHVWDSATGRRLFSVPYSYVLSWNPYSPSGDRLAVNALPDTDVGLYDGQSGERIGLLPDSSIHRLAFSPDGKIIATGGNYPLNNVSLWSAQTGEKIRVFGQHRNIVKSVRFSPDGSLLVTGSADRKVFVWDVADGTRLATLKGHIGSVYAAAFDPTGRFLATGSADRTARLWDRESMEQIVAFYGHEDEVDSVAFDESGRLLASSETNGTIRIWDAMAVHRQILRGHEGFVYDVAISSDGKRVVSCGWDHTVRMWDVETRSEVKQWKLKNQYVSSVRMSKDGRQIAAYTPEGLSWWNIDDGEPPRTRPNGQGKKHFIIRPSFNHDGTRLAVPNGTELNVLDSNSGKLITARTGTGQAIGEVCYSPDGSFVVGLCVDGVCIWDTVDYERTDLLKGDDRELLAMALSPDGKLVATSSANSIKIWDLRTKQVVAQISLPTKVFALDFSPDGTRLAAGCSDGTLRLFDLRNYEEVIVLRGHQDYIIGLAFSPDGTKIVTGSGDKTIRIWDASQRRKN